MISELIAFVIGVVLGIVGAHLINRRKILRLQRDLNELRDNFLRMIEGMFGGL